MREYNNLQNKIIEGRERYRGSLKEIAVLNHVTVDEVANVLTEYYRNQCMDVLAELKKEKDYEKN